MPRPLQAGIYGSSFPDTGSTVRGVFELHKDGYVPNVNFACVITGSPDAGIVSIARDYKMPTERIGIFPRSSYATDGEHQNAIIAFCDKHRVDSLWQTGRIRQLGSKIIRRFHGCCWNQHPGLILPGELHHGQRLDFGGSGMHGRAPYAAALYFARLVNASEACAYVIAHHMDPNEGDIDSGSIIRRLAVPMDLKYDTADTLQSRGKKAERMLMAWVHAEYAATRILPKITAPSLARTRQEINFILQAREQAIREFPNG